MAILAASEGRRVADTAKEMSRTREVIEPRPDHRGRFQQSYVRLINELEQRGWVPAKVAEHARRRA